MSHAVDGTKIHADDTCLDLAVVARLQPVVSAPTGACVRVQPVAHLVDKGRTGRSGPSEVREGWHRDGDAAITPSSRTGVARLGHRVLGASRPRGVRLGATTRRRGRQGQAGPPASRRARDLLPAPGVAPGTDRVGPSAQAAPSVGARRLDPALGLGFSRTHRRRSGRAAVVPRAGRVAVHRVVRRDGGVPPARRGAPRGARHGDLAGRRGRLRWYGEPGRRAAPHSCRLELRTGRCPAPGRPAVPADRSRARPGHRGTDRAAGTRDQPAYRRALPRVPAVAAGRLELRRQPVLGHLQVRAPAVRRLGRRHRPDRR